MKISVICPTFGRPERHEHLYKGFKAQTYLDRELLVLDDSKEPSPFFQALKDPQVSYIHSTEVATIGAKRNRLVEMAQGQIIAHFDDDDHYAPTYLETMYQLLGDSDFIKLAKWLAFREADGSFWQWDTTQIAMTHYLVPGRGIVLTAPNFHKSHQDIKAFSDKTLWGYGFSYLYRKAICKECHFEDTNKGEDYKFVCKLREQGYKVRYTKDGLHLALHTIHATSSSKIYPQKRLTPDQIHQLLPWLTGHL